MPDENSTQIAVVLDRSGSMAAISQATIDGFNEFLKSQRLVPGKCQLMLVQFDHEYQVVYDRPIAEAPLLDAQSFVPRGTTALLDAMGRSIDDLGTILKNLPESDRPHKVIVAVITDGQENASRDYRRERVFQMVNHQRETYKWEFMFLAANQDAITEAGKLGIPPDAALAYRPNNVMGALESFSGQAILARSARSGRPAASMRFSEADRKRALAPDPPAPPANRP